MTVVLEIKEKIKAFYAEYGYAITLVLKFALALSVFMSVNKVMGYTKALMSIYPILLFALISSLMSTKSIVYLAAIQILGHSYGLGLEALGLTAVIMLLLFLFAVRFDENDSTALLLTPLSLALGVPCLIPICYGIKGKPASAVSVGCGTFIFYYLHMLNDKAPVLQHAEAADMLKNIQVLVDGILDNRLMLVNMAAMVFVVIVVYCISRFSLDYIWHIAIVAGALIYVAVMFCGGLFLDMDVPLIATVLGAVAAIVLALIMEFFVLNVDYSRTERLEFEDDEYYYYVKAVPKMSISMAQREIKKISTDAESAEKDDAVLDKFLDETSENNEEFQNIESKLEDSLNDL